MTRKKGLSGTDGSAIAKPKLRERVQHTATPKDVKGAESNVPSELGKVIGGQVAAALDGTSSDMVVKDEGVAQGTTLTEQVDSLQQHVRFTPLEIVKDPIGTISKITDPTERYQALVDYLINIPRERFSEKFLKQVDAFSIQVISQFIVTQQYELALSVFEQLPGFVRREIAKSVKDVQFWSLYFVGHPNDFDNCIDIFEDPELIGVIVLTLSGGGFDIHPSRAGYFAVMMKQGNVEQLYHEAMNGDEDDAIFICHLLLTRKQQTTDIDRNVRGIIRSHYSAKLCRYLASLKRLDKATLELCDDITQATEQEPIVQVSDRYTEKTEDRDLSNGVETRFGYGITAKSKRFFFRIGQDEKSGVIDQIIRQGETTIGEFISDRKGGYLNFYKSSENHNRRHGSKPETLQNPTQEVDMELGRGSFDFGEYSLRLLRKYSSHLEAAVSAQIGKTVHLLDSGTELSSKKERTSSQITSKELKELRDRYHWEMKHKYGGFGGGL